MELTAESIRGAEFNPAWKGYSPLEVDTFIDQIAIGVETLQAKIRELSGRPMVAESVGLSTSGAATEEAVKRTLRLAQRAADLVVGEAKAAAERTLEEANAKSQRVLAEAERSADLRMHDANAEAERFVAHRQELAEQQHNERMHELGLERAEVEAQLATRQREVDRLRILATDVRDKLRASLKDQLARVDEDLPSV
jgi:DivIVA domain-containing protein